MRAAHTNKPEGRRYNEEFSYWLKANKFGSVDKSTRSRLLECLARRDEIESWRVTLATSDRPEAEPSDRRPAALAENAR